MAHVVVVGAGIGGLTAAAALERKGWQVTVLERAPSIEPVGSGLAIAPNALRALDTVGIGDHVRKLAAMQGQAGIRRADGRWLSRTSAEAATERYGDPTVLLLRASLVELLAGALAEGTIRLNTAVAEISQTADHAVVVTADGAELAADLVVAADGINSATRARIFPEHPGPAYAGVTSWRVLARGSGLTTSESWGGRGLVFGVAPLVDDLVYCYATATVPAGQKAEGGELAELVRLFGDWHDPIPRLLAEADPAKVLRHDIYSLEQPLPAFHQGRIALVGDAAHAMTPNLGQGACQAIEDAIVLAHLADANNLESLDAYTAARLPRTTPILTRSRTICRMTSWRNPIAVTARNSMIALVGKLGPTAALRQMDTVFAWQPPRD
ncbi:monooxygenase [Acrocarpospora phusangensis]|uniref:Monooxygenase n=1 Tax=Acrocarpospora phusangensis TaxID=1070424 RepID=A0A919US65_9ACTN|nr:FAD-dependent oxidoreductase [Acrocarpospora phusangensis]GIH26165.1 monooxygenase [Acrocarpospora phusangensis]